MSYGSELRVSPNSCFCGVVVSTSAYHAEGPRFDPGWKHIIPNVLLAGIAAFNLQAWVQLTSLPYWKAGGGRNFIEFKTKAPRRRLVWCTMKLKHLMSAIIANNQPSLLPGMKHIVWVTHQWVCISTPPGASAMSSTSEVHPQLRTDIEVASCRTHHTGVQWRTHRATPGPRLY